MTHLFKNLIFQEFKKNETKLHELNYLFWECTNRCNLNCLHCGSDCSKDKASKDMPLDDFLLALDTIENIPENFTVVLTGGEPLMRKDLEKCGREIRKRKMRWGLVSNAYLYNHERHNSLMNAGIGAITFSLDGLPKSHNWLRNTHQSFSLIDNAIDLVTSAPSISFDIVTCVNSRNLHELPALYDYLNSKNVKAWRLFTIFPIGRAKDNPELSLSDFQFKELLDFIIEKRKQNDIDVKFSCEGYLGKYDNKVRDAFFFCRAGINIGSVLNDGSISACPNIDIDFAQGNIYTDNFYSIWQNRFLPFRNREWTKKGKCAKCSDHKYCEGNGLHFWHGTKKEVLVCHKEKIDSTMKLEYNK